MHKIDDETIHQTMLIGLAGMIFTAYELWSLLDALTEGKYLIITGGLAVWLSIMMAFVWYVFPPKFYMVAAALFAWYYLFG